jgi:phosphinothricin acetyltransferase
MIIRDASPQDLPSICDIINYYRANTSYLWDRTPLTMNDMTVWYAEHRQAPYAALVAEEDGAVAGYASLSRFRPYRGYDPTAENSIYLAPDRPGRGIGRALMTALLARARENGLAVVTAWIDSDNLRSVHFHEKFGFSYVGTLKDVGQLDGRAVSVVIMQRAVGQDGQSGANT